MIIGNPFDRPVIILAAPRSGSTLLFETLSQSADFWTVGGESHSLFESIPRFNPATGRCDSNALFAEDATPPIIQQIRLWFYQLLRDSKGRSVRQYRDAKNLHPRLLEKTPKNSLRVSLLNAIFPDALFIYLYRNPRENVSSLMDAWKSGRFVTYQSLPGRDANWSLLLPPDWQRYHSAALEEIAAFQWKSANTMILQELSKLDRGRWIAVSYGQQVRQTVETIRRVCKFCDVSADNILQSLSSGQTQLSRYTLTPPASNKWHKNARALRKVLPNLRETMDYIRNSADELPADEFDLSVDTSLLGRTSKDRIEPDAGALTDMDRRK
jgi:LPS sulfotransferase NodH